ncbi:DUF7546 family protein [Halocalculus aciditolerans]|uniref:Uncharacterized protein n=1 Tax=Halocalculus aciditolerans TaxID=1383812 RepID=A0A830FEJ1_9EURY|nr:hypothetical protein [Halocalculus aciditolerans]GGL66922.1 hypothetical protein GCM10009039_26140 [Halocalculus aciditolerans]
MTTTRRSRAGLAALVAVEATLLAWYVLTANSSILAPRYLLYPFVWTTAGAVAVTRAWPVSGGRRRRLLAGGLAVVYLGVLLVANGVVATTAAPPSLTVSWLPPGWGPAVLATTSGLRVAIIPFKLVGVLSLTYLVYARLVDAAALAASALVGLFSCVSCTYPLVTALLGGGLGGGLLGAMSQSPYAYDASTVVFLVTLVLLDRSFALPARFVTAIRWAIGRATPPHAH